MELGDPLTPKEASRLLRLRLWVAGSVVLGVFLLLGLRLWQLQVVAGAYFHSLSDSNRLRIKRVAGLRGIIYDRKGRILVDNRPSFDIRVLSENPSHFEKVLDSLTLYLPKSEDWVPGSLWYPARRLPHEGVVVKQDVDWQTLAVVESHQVEMPGVSVEVHPKRRYPPQGFAAHLLGYVGEIGPQELSRLSGYFPGEIVGKFGVEKSWEPYLRGKSGFQYVEVDSGGRGLRVLKKVEPQSGLSLVLTLDWEVQVAAERAMAGKEGALVVLDPRDGAVLAMVSHPTFDPNVFARGIRVQEWHQLISHPFRPLTNRAIQGQYPPGSIFKLVLAAAALEEGVVAPSTRFFCPGGLRFGKRLFRCWKRVGHGSVDLHEAMVESCDVYFYQLGQRLGVDTIAAYARRLGLGQPTGIALDHEKAGVIPDRAWKRKVLGAPWYAGETLSVAIGQGYVLVTPLQMALLTTAIANGGKIYRPYLVERVETARGEVVWQHHPEIRWVAGIREETFRWLRHAMRDVVHSPSGTGKKARLPGMWIGGKTGTAQTASGFRGKQETLPRLHRDHAWFVAFAPVESPEIAVACLVEHAGESGGAVAAPIVRQFLEQYFALTQEKRNFGSEIALSF